MPEACDNHEIIKWPKAAEGPPKTVLFGETHNVCNEDNFACTYALIKSGLLTNPKPKKRDVTLLFEGANFGEKILCTDETSSFSNKCYGWNTKSKHVFDLRELLLEHTIINEMFWALEEKLRPLLPQLMNGNQMDLAINILKENVKKAKNSRKEDIVKLQKTMKDQNPGLTVTSNFEEINNLRIELAKRTYQSVKSSNNQYLELVNQMTILSERSSKTAEQLNQGVSDEDKSIDKPNKSLLKAIKTHSKPKNSVVIAYAGLAHVTKGDPEKLRKRHETPNNKENFAGAMKPFTPKQNKAVKKLYQSLDKFRDDNPYAVLRCMKIPDDEIRQTKSQASAYRP